jgi:hypothetical protein
MKPDWMADGAAPVGLGGNFFPPLSKIEMKIEMKMMIRRYENLLTPARRQK